MSSDDAPKLPRNLGLTPGSDFDEIAALGRAAEALRLTLAERGPLPDELAAVRTTIGEVTGARAKVTSRQIEALISLGVLGRVISGGSVALIWMESGSVPATAVGDRAREGDQLGDVETEIFRLDLAIDVAFEKLLLYRVALVLEAVAAVAILRQIVVSIL
ncbi:MAG: hypothetical protein OEM67_04155 [Thermoleophilia bacterium]|nr:hypothetical protein [Thermoleophilia bacterium]MDH3725192.1 hypothetical protein [Thermoleophilia bacterium]